MKFELKPREGAGPIEFGMTSNQVRELIRGTPKCFKRTPMSAHPVDYFESLGLFVNYDRSGRVESLEFDDTADLMLNGVKLIRLAPESVRKFLAKLGAKFEETSDSIFSDELGLSFWFPDKDNEPNGPAQSIVAFLSGYYD